MIAFGWYVLGDYYSSLYPSYTTPYHRGNQPAYSQYFGNVLLTAPLDYVLNVNLHLFCTGYIRYGADNKPVFQCFEVTEGQIASTTFSVKILREITHRFRFWFEI